MIINPATHYDELYWTAQKPYRAVLPDGRIETRMYGGPALWWDGFQPIIDAILAALDPHRPTDWFDAGCGAGCAVAGLVHRNVDARGMDISQYAISHAPHAVRSRVVQGNVLEEPAGRVFGAVSAFDLVEHIYGADQDRLWSAFERLTAPGGYLVLDVATAHTQAHEWEPEAGKEIPLEREWQSISGHVFVKPAAYWDGWARARGWTLQRDVMLRFEAWRRSTPGYDVLEAWGSQNFMVFQH